LTFAAAVFAQNDRIITAGSAMTETAYALGLCDKIVATDRIFTRKIIQEAFCCKVNVYHHPCTDCPYIIPDKNLFTSHIEPIKTITA
jgi:hypothetical protein